MGVRWWFQAAEQQGHPEAQVVLANAYAWCEGLPEDATKSLR